MLSQRYPPIVAFGLDQRAEDSFYMISWRRTKIIPGPSGTGADTDRAIHVFVASATVHVLLRGAFMHMRVSANSNRSIESINVHRGKERCSLIASEMSYCGWKWS